MNRTEDLSCIRHHALLVMPDAEERWMLEDGLIRCGAIWGISAVHNAETAADICGRFDVLVLDPAVLGKDSVPLIQTVRNLPGLHTILLLTDAAQDGETLRLCWEAGADRMIRRPYSIREIIRHVRELLNISDDPQLEIICGRLLEQHGFSRKLSGTGYVQRAAVMLYDSGLMPMKTLYRLVAAAEHTSAENVEFAIRSALRAANAACGTNKEFLYGLTEEMKQYENNG